MLAGGLIRPTYGFVRVTLDVHPPDRRRRDLDNVLKPVLDLLELVGVVENDYLVAELTARRLEPRPAGRIRLAIAEICPNLLD